MFSWIRVSSVSLRSSQLSSRCPRPRSKFSEQVGSWPSAASSGRSSACAGASPDELEKRGDELRIEKNFLDAIDYYQAALKRRVRERVPVQ